MWLTKITSILGHGLCSRQILLKNHKTLNMLVVLPLTKYNSLRTYKNFGHKRDPPEHPITKVYMLAAIGLMFYQFVNWEK